MLIVRDFTTDWQPFENGAIVCMGVFDGVHRGHRRVLHETLDWARDRGAAAGVVTFDRKPSRPGMPPSSPLLVSVRHRLEIFRQMGFDFVVLLRFTEELAAMTPETFVRKILCDRLGVRGVVIGFDQRFGKGRAGGYAELACLGQALGFEVRQTPAESVLNDAVSSTRIREAIRAGRLEDAAAMLGRPVTCQGTAEKDDHASRKTGYPTYTLDLHHEVRPPSGVYAVRVSGPGIDTRALCNISCKVRPEHDDSSDGVECVVQVGFRQTPQESLTGKELDLVFLAPIRKEMPFATPDDMRERIRCDFTALDALPDTADG